MSEGHLTEMALYLYVNALNPQDNPEKQYHHLHLPTYRGENRVTELLPQVPQLMRNGPTRHLNAICLTSWTELVPVCAE